MKKLIKAIEYLKENDSNGNYNEILEDIDNEKISITEAKIECMEILQRWYNEQENDMQMGNSISKIALELQKSL